MCAGCRSRTPLASVLHAFGRRPALSGRSLEAVVQERRVFIPRDEGD